MTTLALLLVAALSATTPTAPDIHQGQPRWMVQNRILHDKGHMTGMYAGAHHRHLFKTYPTADGGTVRVEYLGPLCQCAPLVGPYWVKEVH